jgi:hypothetical protein
MRNEGDLSTEDLARPGGASRQEPPAGGAGEPAQDTGPTEAGVRGDGTPPPPDDVAAGAGTAREPSDLDQPASGPMGSQGRTGADLRGDQRMSQRDDAAGQSGDVALLDRTDEDRFRQRWSDVQATFVDDPKEAVRTADGLVAELMQSLAQAFSGHKGRLESQWQRGGDPDTEELRQALQRYRSFFNRLLST